MAGATDASTRSCQAWGNPVPTPNVPGSIKRLDDVVATSACNAWAVGSAYFSTTVPEKSVILHWNGHQWKRIPSPNPGSQVNELNGVDAMTASDAWAVGTYGDGSRSRALILHWNGHEWKKKAAPSLTNATYSFLNDVNMTSGSNGWAVGSYESPSQTRTLILHWNGQEWNKQRSPNPNPDENYLSGVSATSPHNAWAVGNAGAKYSARTFVLHWNGRAWSREATPNLTSSVGNYLTAVRATSDTNAWATGYYYPSSSAENLILHWNGHSWRKQRTPTPGDGSTLNGIEAASAASAWAVGSYQPGLENQTLILHWNGRAWVRQPSTSPGTSALLYGVASVSPSRAWAVGSYNGTVHAEMLVLSCC